MIFEQIPVGQMQNFSYLIGDEDSKEGAVVDPAWEVDKILKIAKKHNLNIKKILMTHTHMDHIQGVKELAGETGAVVYVHRNGEEEIKSLGVANINVVSEGDVIKIGKLNVEVIHTPGHIPDMICLLVNNKLLTGDTLFVEGCGRVDLPGSDMKKMFESLQRIKKMDEDIEIYPGHDYGSMPSSTIKYEKENNPYLKCSSFEEFSTIR